MDHHLTGGGEANSRNGYGKKTVVTDTGKIELEVPRDRRSSFDPQLIAKYQRRFPGFDDKVVSMYARGMSARGVVKLAGGERIRGRHCSFRMVNQAARATPATSRQV
jgi:transposase-like protein